MKWRRLRRCPGGMYEVYGPGGKLLGTYSNFTKAWWHVVTGKHQGR